MKIITQNHSSDKKIFSSITIFFTTYKISAIFKASNAYKKKGVPVVLLFQYLFSLIFANRSMYMNRMTGKHDETLGKDTVYRFLNSSSINWTRFTSLLTQCLNVIALKKLNCYRRCTIMPKSPTNMGFAFLHWVGLMETHFFL